VNRYFSFIFLIFLFFPIELITSVTSIKSSKELRAETNNSSKEIEVNESFQNDLYLLGPGDVLNIKVFSAPEFSGQYIVLSDGSISSLFINKLNVSGLTLNDASLLIEETLKDEIIDPSIELTLIKTRDIKVLIIGEVERPGFYTLNGSQSKDNLFTPTLVDALQKAGGLTNSANLKNISLIRDLPKKISGKKEANLDLISLLKEGDEINNPILFDGDIINVKKADIYNIDQLKLSNSNLYSETIAVNVIGEVNNPGRIVLKRNTPLNQAILAAGGPVNIRSKKNNIQLLRINNNGTLKKSYHSLTFRKGISKSKNPILIDGDTLFVGRSSLASLTDGIKSIADPVTSIATPWSIIQLINSR
tara:strand:- start:4862 stop:5947 length:1086 start_codon:yes stop_codon:yes gene_type:complete